MHETKILSDDGKWITGVTTYFTESGSVDRKIEWTKISDTHHKEVFWFLYPPTEIFEKLGMQVGNENAAYLQKIFEEDWINGVYYFNGVCHNLKKHANDIAKLIINDLSQMANEANSDVKTYICINDFNNIANAIFETKALDKRFFKDVIQRVHNGEVIEHVLKDSKYVGVDASDIKDVVAKVISAHSDKLDGTDKIKNWLIGQVMKELKGSANPQVVRNEIFSQLG